MDLRNDEKIGRALDCVRKALIPFLDARLTPGQKRSWGERLKSVRVAKTWNPTELDVLDCLKAMDQFWNEAFRAAQFDRAEHALVNQLIGVRNRHAHPRGDTVAFSDEDTWRALDTAERLLRVIASPEAEQVRALRTARTPSSAAPPARTSFESLYVADLFGDGITLRASSRGLRHVQFSNCEPSPKPGPIVARAAEQIREYLEGRRAFFDLPLDIEGTEFQKQVWSVLRKIPYGEQRSYRWVAQEVGKPEGSQAVGQANKRNPLLIVIPCHRVTAADGSIGGWTPGPNRKRKLIDLESANASRLRASAQ